MKNLMTTLTRNLNSTREFYGALDKQSLVHAVFDELHEHHWSWRRFFREDPPSRLEVLHGPLGEEAACN